MSEQRPGSWRYFSVISSVFVAVVLISNTVAVKIVHVFGLNLPGGIVVFPISYIFGDVLTEVYGYRASRRIIWTGMGCAIMMSLVYFCVQSLPPAPFWTQQEAYEAILGVVPRVTLASIAGFFCGEFTNSYVLARMKVLTRGRHLWSRTIGSTIAGEGVDSVVFGVVAFGGVFPSGALAGIIFANYIVKVAYEVLATPATYLVVGFLKRAEGVDVYDVDTNFNPFHFEFGDAAPLSTRDTKASRFPDRC